jgi:hypothetical protein
VRPSLPKAMLNAGGRWGWERARGPRGNGGSEPGLGPHALRGTASRLSSAFSAQSWAEAGTRAELACVLGNGRGPVALHGFSQDERSCWHFFFFGTTGLEPHGFELSREVLYYSSHMPQPGH